MINEPAPAKDSSEWYIKEFEEEIGSIDDTKEYIEILQSKFRNLISRVSQESKRQGIEEGIKEINRYIEAYHYDNYRMSIYKEIQAILQALITDKKL